MGVQFENLKLTDGGGCWWQGGVGSMTVPIDTPGDMTGLSFGAHVRARGNKDVVKLQLSFDEGKTWTDAAQIHGPTPGTTQYFRYTAVPARTRKALLRYEMTGNNTIGVFSFRVDADYRDPLASGAVHPFVVTHRWKESGQEKTFQTIVNQLPTTYQITTGAEPEMVSVEYGMK
jgi:hypothetical protein